MLIDVSMPVEKGIIVRPGCAPVDISVRTFNNKSEGEYETAILSMPLHTATHVDLVFPDKEYSLERMIGPGKLIDVTGAGGNTISLEDIEGKTEINEGEFVFFRTDWSGFFGTEKYFEHPELAPEIIQWLIARKVNVVGIDAQGLARGSKHGEYDKQLCKNDIVVLENLVNLSLLPESGFQVYCFPLKIENTDAMPARVIVELKEE